MQNSCFDEHFRRNTGEKEVAEQYCSDTELLGVQKAITAVSRINYT